MVSKQVNAKKKHMAKQTKTPAVAVETPATDKPSAAAIAAKAAKDVFTRILDGDSKPTVPTSKLAPQAMVIVNAIEAAGSVTREDLNIALGDGVTGPLKTRQPVGRIVSYYQKALIASGTVTITKASAAA